MISEQAKQRMRNLAARYPVARSAVMPALYIAQQEEGYITQEALQAVAEAIGLTVDDVERRHLLYHVLPATAGQKSDQGLHQHLVLPAQL
jgi:NADH:ubiquinone oxidoreductase subunit E